MSRSRRSDGKTRRVRYAVVGLGYISQAAMLPAFAQARENSELAALVSGDPKKLRSLGRKYKVAHTYSYEQYADCLKSGTIDAVYIGLPNHMHRAYSEAAARAGVHVLCEKPMAFDEVECEAMIAAAEEAKVKLMIAYRLHFERGNLEMIETISPERSASRGYSIPFSRSRRRRAIHGWTRAWAAVRFTTWASTASMRLDIYFAPSPMRCLRGTCGRRMTRGFAKCRR